MEVRFLPPEPPGPRNHPWPEGSERVSRDRLPLLRHLEPRGRPVLRVVRRAAGADVSFVRHGQPAREPFLRFLRDRARAGPGASLAAGGSLEERKVVTMLFADLTASTEMSSRLDPEDLRSVLRPFFDAMADEIGRYGGTVEKFIGDAVVAAFGAPVAHEDDPERAIRCGTRDAAPPRGAQHRGGRARRQRPRDADRDQHRRGARPLDRGGDRDRRGREHRGTTPVARPTGSRRRRRTHLSGRAARRSRSPIWVTCR